jgi:hypothetical protein
VGQVVRMAFVDNSEEHRHRCEVRYLLRKRKELGRQWLVNHIELIEKRRGRVHTEFLKKDLMRQWINGNRGDIDGLWFD